MVGHQRLVPQLPHRWSLLLPLAAGDALPRAGGPHPLCDLHRVYAWFVHPTKSRYTMSCFRLVRILLEDVDRRERLKREGRGQAAQGAADDHARTP